ncbi:MAG TPA: hypothetical protein VEQ59_18695, partial [Polyangiaceae bacterium]|nr:hypothetical protein [Polyangiaceae bacterium]
MHSSSTILRYLTIPLALAAYACDPGTEATPDNAAGTGALPASGGSSAGSSIGTGGARAGSSSGGSAVMSGGGGSSNVGV